MNSNSDVLNRLADAIDNGSKGRLQTQHEYFGVGSCCALGAAYFGFGLDPADLDTPFDQSDLDPADVIAEHIGIATRQPLIAYPADGPELLLMKPGDYIGVLTLIVYLNDDLEWSFSEISSYLRECAVSSTVAPIQPENS